MLQRQKKIIQSEREKAIFPTHVPLYPVSDVLVVFQLGPSLRRVHFPTSGRRSLDRDA